jgi:hypothetical protein
MAEPSAEPKPNVVVAHLAHGIEVVHLYSGRTLCQVPVRVGSDAAHSCIPFMLISVRDRVCARSHRYRTQITLASGSYADINGDGAVDRAMARVGHAAATHHEGACARRSCDNKAGCP